MGKKKIPDLFGQDRTHSEHVTEHVENTQRTRFKQYKKTELKTFSIRLLPQDIVTLTKYFTRRGISLSQGIRQVLLDFIDREGLD